MGGDIMKGPPTKRRSEIFILTAATGFKRDNNSDKNTWCTS